MKGSNGVRKSRTNESRRKEGTLLTVRVKNPQKETQHEEHRSAVTIQANQSLCKGYSS
jgi:hypothetical protein